MNQSMKAEIGKLSAHDKNRLIQCLFCHRDPVRCGAGEADEDNNGMCKKYLGNMLFVPKDAGLTARKGEC